MKHLHYFKIKISNERGAANDKFNTKTSVQKVKLTFFREYYSPIPN